MKKCVANRSDSDLSITGAISLLEGVVQGAISRAGNGETLKYCDALLAAGILKSVFYMKKEGYMQGSYDWLMREHLACVEGIVEMRDRLHSLAVREDSQFIRRIRVYANRNIERFLSRGQKAKVKSNMYGTLQSHVICYLHSINHSSYISEFSSAGITIKRAMGIDDLRLTPMQAHNEQRLMPNYMSEISSIYAALRRLIR